MTIAASHPAFRTALADLDRGVERLADCRDGLARDVGDLLDGGWTGLAADAFAAGWEQWCAGAREVLAGLATMRQLVGDVHEDLSERDASSAAALAEVTARLGERLGR